jgi:hypothetical protein
MATVKVEGTLQPMATQVAPVKEVVKEEKALVERPKLPEGAVLDKSPKPLNGRELAAILIFRFAEQLAMVMENNPKFGEIVAYPAVRLKGKVEVEIESESVSGGLNKVVFKVEPSVVTVDTRLHPSLPEMLRVESGIGLWHRVSTPGSGSFHLLQATPTKKVMQHLLEMAEELGKTSGFKAGLNKEG